MTFVGIESGSGSARLTLRGDQLSPRVLGTGQDEARIAFVATTALLLAGDRVDIEIDVGPGCRLDLIDTAGTVAYDASRREPGDRRSEWNVRIRVAAGGVLTWHGQPFVVADGSRPHRSIGIDLAADGVACLRETLVLGRAGESGGDLTSSTIVTVADTPLLVEDLDLRREVRCLPGIVASKVIDSVLLLGRRPVDADPAGMQVYELAGCGAVARHLGDELHRSGGENCFVSWRVELAVPIGPQ